MERQTKADRERRTYRETDKGIQTYTKGDIRKQTNIDKDFISLKQVGIQKTGQGHTLGYKGRQRKTDRPRDRPRDRQK
jgi:hypothetical protein